MILMKGRKLLIIGLVIFSVVLTSFTFYAWQVVYTPNILVEQESRTLLIRPGDSFKDLQNKLYDEHIVGDLMSFSFLARLMDYDKQMKPGLYELKANMSNIEAVRLLRSGQQVPLNVTFNNARTKHQLAERLEGKLMFSSAELDSLLYNPAMAEKYGFDTATFISMFIPNTYEFFWTTSSEEFLERMHTEYERFWTEERKQKAEAMGLSQGEVATLASIVQAETSKRDEMPRVAGVYLNRLNRNMRLEADPTLVYALGDFGIRRILNEHKEIESPYNTYMYRGLPPGPINLPSIHAIDAVLNAEDHKYLFFCAKEDFSGYHNFATTYREHINNANRYRKALNKRKIYR